MKLIQSFPFEGGAVKVYWSKEWEEFQVRRVVGGKHREAETYHTNDKADALATARTMVQFTGGFADMFAPSKR